MQIHGPAHLHGPQSINAPHTSRAPQQNTAPTSNSGGDKLEISDAARLASQLSDVPEIREDRVAEIRAAIANGTYETNDRLDIAVSRLLDEIG